MSEFLDIALSFPPVVFSFGLIIVVLYWLTVIIGALDVDIVDVGAEAELDAGGGFWSAFGFGAVPFTVVLSLWITLGWIVTVLGTTWVRSTDMFIPPAATGTAVLVAGIGVGMLGAKLLTTPLAKLFEDAPATSHADLVGKVCVVRTGTVTLDSGRPRSPTRKANCSSSTSAAPRTSPKASTPSSSPATPRSSSSTTTRSTGCSWSSRCRCRRTSPSSSSPASQWTGP